MSKRTGKGTGRTGKPTLRVVGGGAPDGDTPDGPRSPDTVRKARRPRLRCKARSSRTGEPCKAWAVHGSTVCIAHGAAAHREKAAARHEATMATARLGGKLGLRVTVDPAEALMELVEGAASDVRVLEAAVEGLELGVGGMEATLVAGMFGVAPHPYVAMLERARTLSLKASTAALAANVDERRVRLAESRGRAMADVIRAAVEATNPTPDERRDAMAAAAKALRRIGVEDTPE